MENHTQRFAGQVFVLDAVFQLVFQLIRQVQNVDDLLGGEIQHFQQMVHGSVCSFQYFL